MPLLEWPIPLLRHRTFAGKFRLVQKLCPRHGMRTAKVYGSTMHLDLSDFIQWQIYLGCFEDRDAKRMKNHLPRGGVMIDAGANVGFFTALAAHCVGPTGKVFAVEPSPYAFGKLQQLISDNKLSQVHAEQIALSDTPGELPLYITPDEAHNHTPTLVPSEGLKTVQVPVKTLDERLDAWGVTSIDVLKMDVEGYELHVLKGAHRTLAANRIKTIFLEFNESWLQKAGASGTELWRFLEAQGFKPQYGLQIDQLNSRDAVSGFFAR